MYGDDRTSRTGTGVSSLYRPFENKPLDVSHLASSSAESIIAPLASSVSASTVQRPSPVSDANADKPAEDSENDNNFIAITNEGEGNNDEEGKRSRKKKTAATTKEDKKMKSSSLSDAKRIVQKEILEEDFTGFQDKRPFEREVAMLEKIIMICSEIDDRISDFFLKVFINDIDEDEKKDAGFPYGVDIDYESDENKDLLWMSLALNIKEKHTPSQKFHRKYDVLKSNPNSPAYLVLKNRVLPVFGVCLDVAYQLGFHEQKNNIKSAHRLKTCDKFALFALTLILESQMYEALQMWPSGESKEEWIKYNGSHTIPRSTVEWINRYGKNLALAQSFLEKNLPTL